MISVRSAYSKDPFAFFLMGKRSQVAGLKTL